MSIVRLASRCRSGSVHVVARGRFYVGDGRDGCRGRQGDVTNSKRFVNAGDEHIAQGDTNNSPQSTHDDRRATAYFRGKTATIGTLPSGAATDTGAVDPRISVRAALLFTLLPTPADSTEIPSWRFGRSGEFRMKPRQIAPRMGNPTQAG